MIAQIWAVAFSVMIYSAKNSNRNIQIRNYSAFVVIKRPGIRIQTATRNSCSTGTLFS
jgi:hypothetical protein